MRIGEHTYLQFLEGGYGRQASYRVIYNDGHTSKTLGRFRTRAEAIAKFGDLKLQDKPSALIRAKAQERTVAKQGSNPNKSVAPVSQHVEALPDEELLTLFRRIISDDPSVAQRVNQYRARGEDASVVWRIGLELLAVPELLALADAWPQYVAKDGIVSKSCLRSRIAAIEQSNLLRSLSEWLAARLWDSAAHAGKPQVR